MNIVDAKVIITCPGRNFVTLKIVTEDGIHGLGDATLNGRELAVASYLSEHVIPLIAAELFGVKVLGRLLGVVLTADGVAEAVSPMAVGYLRDATGSYRIGFFGLILFALVGAVAVAALPRPRAGALIAESRS